MNKIFSISSIHSNLCLLLMLSSFSTFAESESYQAIAISELGAFETEFSQIKQVALVEGMPVLGTVTYKPNSAFKISLPFVPQQVVYLKVDGQQVKKGELIATISGIEVEHFYEEYAAAKLFYHQTKKHLDSTKSYADENTIKREAWLTLNKTYLDAALNFEHLSHVKNQLTTDSEGNSYLVSPEDGAIKILSGINEPLFKIVPAQSILVKAAVSAVNTRNIAGFKIDGFKGTGASDSCQLKADIIEPIVINGKQQVWSRLNNDCKFAIGSQLSLIPTYKANGFAIPRTALFELDDQNYVAVKQNQQLYLAMVTIVGTKKGNYVVQSKLLSDNAQILTSSVSVVQGLFLGLGD